jgi:hypothetical protein
MSPPDVDGAEQYYVHQHQVDHNLVLHGRRTFILLNPAWDQPHHRSISGEEGSLVLNPSIRDNAFSYATEFIPVNLRERPDLQAARAVEPWRWSWHNGHIRRQHG